MCAAGEKEGTLLFSNSTDDGVFQKEIAGFEKKYPGIKVKHANTNPENLVAGIVTAAQVGRAPSTDLVAESVPDIQPLITKGLVRKIDWTKYGIDKSYVTMNGDTPMLLTQRIAGGLVYNTQKVKASELPNTWADLVNPKWAGQIVVDPRGKYLSGLGLIWGKDKAVEWYTKLMQVDKPQLVQGATNSLQRVISGEALISTSAHDAETLEQQATGAPLAIKFLDVVPTSDHFAVVLDKAAHPNAAECFLEWFINGGGAAAQLKYEYKNDKPVPPGIPADSKLAVVTNTQEATEQTAIANAFAALMK